MVDTCITAECLRELLFHLKAIKRTPVKLSEFRVYQLRYAKHTSSHSHKVPSRNEYRVVILSLEALICVSIKSFIGASLYSSNLNMLLKSILLRFAS